jgi:hypothetical protein
MFAVEFLFLLAIALSYTIGYLMGKTHRVEAVPKPSSTAGNTEAAELPLSLAQ